MAITTPQGLDLQAPEALELKTIQPNIAARDNISLVTRYIGLKVFVEDTGLNYQLKGGVQNTDWVQFGDALNYDDFYTKINLQTSGEASVHWNNITTVPTSFPPSAHTHVEANITDLQAYLLNINSELIGDLSNVNIVNPQDNEFLRYIGGNWVNATTGSVSVLWGNITGDIISQLDLQNELQSKKDNFSENTAFNKNFGTTYSAVARGDHGHHIISVPESSAVATATGLELNEVKYGDYKVQSSPLTHKEGRIFYNETSNSFRAYNDISDVALDIGQELWGRVYNDNAYTLPNGTVGYVKGASVPGGDLLCSLADSSILTHAERVLGIFTNDIAPGEFGYITRYGVVRDMDTSLWAIGDILYQDAHNPGALTNERPISPHYPVRLAIVMYSDPLVGVIGVDTLTFTGSDTEVAVDGVLDGIVIYKQHINVVVEGGIIYADITRDDGAAYDLPFILDGVRYALNTTTGSGPGGAARIIIPPGASSTETQFSMLFIKLNAGVPELAITTGAIYEPYANLAAFTVFDAARTLADGKPLMYRRANNAISSEDVGIDGAFGLLTVAVNAIRNKLGSNWLMGQDAVPEVTNTIIRTTLTTGFGSQLHMNMLPAFDGLEYLIYNNTANLVTYEFSNNLIDITSDANGNTLLANNKYYTIRLFYQLNSNGIGDNVIATRPLGSYSNVAEAISDPLRYTVNVNDVDIEEVIYPLYDLVIGRSGGGGTNITLEQLTDLRTKLAGGIGGGGASGGGGTDDKVRISAADTVNDYLFSKLVEGNGITLDIVNPGGIEQLRISSSGDITTVGTGGDYATIQLALAAGRYNLKLISAITETVDWGTHTEIIKLFADELAELTMNVQLTSTLTIMATNIKFMIVGTFITFLNTTIHAESCQFIGNNSINDPRGAIYGKNIHIDLGDNGFKIYLYNVTGLTVYGIAGTAGEANAVGIFGTVTNTILTGDFELGLDLYDGILDNIIGNGNGVRIRGTVGSSIYNAKSLKLYIRNDTISTLFNCELDQFHMYSNTYNAFKTVDSCIFDEIAIPSSGGNINTLYGFTHIINTKFISSDIHVIDDALTLQNCNVTNGTISIDATANKTTIMGCRTMTSIIDNGTNTQLLANNLI